MWSRFIRMVDRAGIMTRKLNIVTEPRTERRKLAWAIVQWNFVEEYWRRRLVDCRLKVVVRNIKRPKVMFQFCQMNLVEWRKSYILE